MAKKKKRAKKKHAYRRPMPKEEEVFYVGVDEPRVVRRTVLEATRDAIQSLQQFENFKAVRREKHDMFVHLKTDIQEIRSSINKLRKALPKAKLRVKLHGEHLHKACLSCGASFHTDDELLKHTLTAHKVVAKPKKVVKPKVVSKPKTGLDKLESELDSIENQLAKLS